MPYRLYLAHLACALPLALALLVPSHAAAQSPETARLVVTVMDPSNAGVPGATVTVAGLEESTKKTPPAPAKTDERGLVTFPDLVPGRYTVVASFPGFGDGVLRSVVLRRGENRQLVTLVITGVSETVTVSGGQEAASSRAATNFGVAMTGAEIALLSDDPSELQKQIAELAGPDAVIRVDSFEGAQLPPKSQIKSVHVTRDQFAAEAAYPGSTFVDVITQAGSGALTANLNVSYRANGLSGTSPFVGARQPEATRNFNGSLSGPIVKDKVDFSLSGQGMNNYTTPVLNQGGSAARLLAARQPNTGFEAYSLLNVALTRDQTLRLGYARAARHQRNLGIGQYDSPERAFDQEWSGYQVRILQAGPIGRRTFQNTRLLWQHVNRSRQASVEQPAVVIQDDRTIGGAQVRGLSRETMFRYASDVDYIRGIHSWRTGVQIDGVRIDSTFQSNYLGTYTFADQAAYDAGTPLLYTRTVGDPRVKYSDFQTAFYLQDDIRISKALTFSPGVRYLLQTHVRDRSGIAPRFGSTWSPFANGRTSLRFSVGVFYWPMEPQGVYEETLRNDGRHLRSVVVLNPSYPDPGVVAGLPPDKYVLGDYSLQRNLRYSAGIDRTLSPRVRMSVLYAYWHQFEFWRGRNLNAPVDGVRPDPEFANIIETLTDGEIRRHDLTMNLNVSMLAPSPAANQALFNWKRVALAATWGSVRAWQSGDGPFNVPPSGDLATEWAPNGSDQPYRFSGSITSTQLRNLTANLSWTANAGSLYTTTTGVDDNQDGLLNDRPDGVRLRSLRTPRQQTLNLRVQYTIMTAGAAPAPVPGGGSSVRRYRVGLSFNASNLTNRANYGGYSGKMTSPDFQQPTLVVNPRRVDVGLNVAF